MGKCISSVQKENQNTKNQGILYHQDRSSLPQTLHKCSSFQMERYNILLNIFNEPGIVIIIINGYLNDHLSASERYKFVLLGPGESGKSTLFKQMILAHGEPYTQYTQQTDLDKKCKNNLSTNLMVNFRILCLFKIIG